MLNMNLDLDITDFVTVGFEAVIKTVDAVGGVEINVTEEEDSASEQLSDLDGWKTDRRPSMPQASPIILRRPAWTTRQSPRLLVCRSSTDYRRRHTAVSAMSAETVREPSGSGQCSH